MPFSRPSLQQLIDRAVADIETRLPGADARVIRSNLQVLSRTHAGAIHGLYGYLDWMSNQVLPDTAESEMLARHASIWGFQRLPAARATGTATLAGNAGAVLPAGSSLQRADGVVYVTGADVTISEDGTAQVALTAAEGGAAGNAASGTRLTIASTVVGIDAAAVLGEAGADGGTDEESDDSLRERLLARLQAPPHGGANFDYVAWAREVPGVTRAWVYPLELGVGTVTVRFAADDATTAPIPSDGLVAQVKAHIDAVRPVTAEVFVYAPVPVPLDFTIEGLDPDQASVRAAVIEELKDLLSRESEPGGTILLSHIKEAISQADQEHDHTLTEPAGDVVHTTGRMAVMGEVTWQ